MKEVLQEPAGLSQADVDNDEKLDEYIRSHITSTYHFCGTCRMASKDSGGVVDQSGRVYGIEG